MPPKPTTVTEYLASLPDDRRKAVKALRKVFKANIDKPFKEGLQYGMLSYFLPHSVYPEGYHCNPDEPLPFASIGSQKGHIGLYLFCIYGSPEDQERFKKEWLASGKKLDMGKACVRVKTLEDVPLDVVGRVLKRMTARRFVKSYEANLPDSVKAKRKRAAVKKA